MAEIIQRRRRRRRRRHKVNSDQNEFLPIRFRRFRRLFRHSTSVCLITENQECLFSFVFY